MKKGEWGGGYRAVFRLGTIQRSFWGVGIVCLRFPGLLFFILYANNFLKNLPNSSVDISGQLQARKSISFFMDDLK